MFIVSFKAQKTKTDCYELSIFGARHKSNVVLYLSLNWLLDGKKFDAITLKILNKRRHRAK